MGNVIYFKAVDGEWWIAIKPICEALGVDYEAQRKNLKDDQILGQLPSEQTVVAADGKLRKMICLPEFFIYGWIFKINSDAPGLQEFQWECYKALYSHFHGSITKRMKNIESKAKNSVLIESLEQKMANKLKDDEDWQLLQELKASNSELSKEIKETDKSFYAEQLSFYKELYNQP